MHRKLLLTSMAMLSLFFMLISVNGHNPGYEVVAVYGSTPTIDGSINVDEWDDASSVQFNNTEVFVKQDGENLYIGFKVFPSPHQVSDDYVAICFDLKNTGDIEEPSLNYIAVAVYPENRTLAENYWTPYSGWTPTRVSDWTASVNSTLEMWQVEFNIPFSKVKIIAGEEKTIGVFFDVYQHEEEEPFTWPPWYENVLEHPEDWGDITSTGYNWIPEFPSWIILPLFLAATLAAIFFKKRLLNQRSYEW